MPLSASGFYIQVTGATTAAPGDVIRSSTWNNTYGDIGNGLTQYMQEFISQPSNRNLMWMNGGFEVWQRTTGLSPVVNILSNTLVYIADRWFHAVSANQDSTISGQPGLTSQSNFSARFRRNAGQTGTALTITSYTFDIDEIYRMRGKFVSLRMLIQAGANFSPSSGTFFIQLFTGTGATSPARRAGVPYTGELTPLNVTLNLTPGAVALDVNLTSASAIGTNITQAELMFLWAPVGTAGAADDVTIDDVQLEVQNSPNTWLSTSYDRATFPEMLEGCKRYYQKTVAYGSFPGAPAGRINALQVISAAASRIGIFWKYPIEVRATGTVGLFNTDAVGTNWFFTSVGASAQSTVDTSTQGTKGVFIYSNTANGVDTLAVIQAQIDASIL